VRLDWGEGISELSESAVASTTTICPASPRTRKSGRASTARAAQRGLRIPAQFIVPTATPHSVLVKSYVPFRPGNHRCLRGRAAGRILKQRYRAGAVPKTATCSRRINCCVSRRCWSDSDRFLRKGRPPAVSNSESAKYPASAKFGPRELKRFANRYIVVTLRDLAAPGLPAPSPLICLHTEAVPLHPTILDRKQEIGIWRTSRHRTFRTPS
jgi:hypothetical protein